jgi:hypothetical protein
MSSERIPPIDLYERIGFTNIEKMKEYGILIGKTYTGDNITEAHEKIFVEKIVDRANRRNKFFIEPEKIPVYSPPKMYPFILNVGHNLKDYYLITLHTLPIPGMTRQTKCVFQLTPCLNTDTYHDQIFMNVRNYACLVDQLQIVIVTVRSNNEVWGLEISAHLLVIIL